MARKKKQWFSIISPKAFGSKVIGETLADDSKKLIGRTIIVNAKELTGDYKKSHINITLAVSDVVDGVAHTSIKGYIVSRPYIQRFLHRGMSVIELINDFKTSDDKSVRVRCMATANNHINSTLKKSIRKLMIEELGKLVNSSSLDNLVFLSTTNKIQKTINNKVKKLYPLRFVEIKKITLL